MKSKKLLYITPAFPVGGLEKLLVLLANSFSKETEKQIVISLSNNNVLQNELRDNIEFIALPRKSRFDPGVIFKLRKIIQSERPDAFISLNFFGYLFLKLAMIGIRPKIKCLIVYQTTIHENKKEHFLHKIYTSLLKKDDQIIAASKNQVKYTLENFNIPENKISVIYNGIDTHHWHLNHPGDNHNIRREYGIPAEAKVIVIAAAFRPEKNHMGAVRSLKMLRDTYNMDAYLLLVGDGNTRIQTEEVTRQLEMQQYVKFTGMQKDLRPFYWAANVFSLCSYAVETFSVAALEAMSCGLPCVLTNIGGAAEMIQDSVNGFLCEPDDKSISDAWCKALQAGFSSENIHQFLVDNFAAETMLEQYRKIL
jgi:glycosyltransferase involved in cell wall biosynthesis